eukprot:TRINITY_DN11842_c0_g1_i2.p1 TRINITY_DN11842_c0_g1~~TRINITY_DN11842_c0_g1_i2.p1  ORF type:complete len:576 (+),score=145.41 TRINITY_DN11842_c0_g1_i2:58-1785(+)
MLRAICVAVLVVHSSFCDEVTHKYEEGDRVWVYGNKIGPFNNPLETYGYFDVLPWCEPHSKVAKKPTLGEALTGDELIKLDVNVEFKKDTSRKQICRKTLSQADADVLKAAIKEQYWYQLFLDDLPTWAAVGKIVKGEYMMYTHQRFSLGYNNNHVVLANMTAENKVAVAEGVELEFTYSVEWKASKIQFDNRFRRYLDESFFEHNIHWVSVLNSFMMVFVLACIVMIVLLRTLKADYARYDKDIDDDGTEFRDESGWKQVHSEVFRVPPQHVLLCALVGTGYQLVVLLFCLIFIAIASVVYADRGALLTYGVISYAITSSVAGYASGRQFVHYAAAGPAISKDWKRTTLLTASLLPGTIAAMIFLLNLVAVYYNSQQAIPFTTMVAVVLIWLFVSLPLVVVGTFIGRHRKKVDILRVSQIPRHIPEKSHYSHGWIAAGGILPFGSIFIELYFVFTSFWNYKYYYVYGFMLLVYVILLLVTMCLAVVFTYYLLNSEDYRWQWSSFALGASTSGYVFLYSVYFFLFKTNMAGFFMTMFYFGYMALFCGALAILCGTVSFITADMFVNRIYRNIKLE